jgi:hypothetical protein
MGEAHAIDLSDLSTKRHNGSSYSVEPETGTGCWNWWEIANARIVGEACDRWFRERYKRTRDRLIDPVAYTKARITREIILAVEAKRERGETVVIPERPPQQPLPHE